MDVRVRGRLLGAGVDMGAGANTGAGAEELQTSLLVFGVVYIFCGFYLCYMNTRVWSLIAACCH